ncbi:hypothetical protein N431DRAFT_357640, partial [Stipitochalara longipes BDJ]
ILRLKISLRVGYINIQGLIDINWKTYNQLLSIWFNFLFMAETWFIDYLIHSRDYYVIVFTLEPLVNLRGRK